MKKLLFTIMLLMPLTCYAELTIDGSSHEAFKASAEKISESLSEEKKEQLGDAMMSLMFANISLEEFEKLDGKTPEKLLRAIDGKTVDQLIELGKQQQNKAAENFTKEMGKIMARAFSQDKTDAKEITKTSKTDEEEKSKKIRQAQIDYISKVNLYNVKSKYYSTYLEDKVPGVSFKLKNQGDKTLSKVEVTVYFKDKNGNVIHEEDYNPVYVVKDTISFSDNKPLKPGYIWQQERGKFYKASKVPTEWKEGSINAKITKVEFLDESSE